LLHFIFINIDSLLFFLNNFRLDGTHEKYIPGRLINHAGEKEPSNNLKPQATLLDKEPILVFTAKRDITAGTEIFFDYGDHSRDSVANFGFLGNNKENISTFNSHPAVAYYM
jgi:hypothetical protein